MICSTSKHGTDLTPTPPSMLWSICVLQTWASEITLPEISLVTSVLPKLPIPQQSAPGKGSRRLLYYTHPVVGKPKYWSQCGPAIPDSTGHHDHSYQLWEFLPANLQVSCPPEMVSGCCCLATKVFIGKLPANGGPWVMIRWAIDEGWTWVNKPVTAHTTEMRWTGVHEHGFRVYKVLSQTTAALCLLHMCTTLLIAQH